MSMQWTRVNRELAITDRQRSGYAYRVRELEHGAILFAEGRISDGKPPTRREECADVTEAMRLAEKWESGVVDP
ncbi:hypothetical protein AB0876_03870 [Mycobacterium sp. NPDC049093]